jgi:hypothetical protein
MSCQSNLRVLAPDVLLSLSAGAQAQTAPSGGANMTFFITSVGSGKGADLGGLEGADRHCQTLAAAAGAGTTLSRERFLLVKSGNAGLRGSRNFNGLAGAERAADEPKSPFTC